MSNLPLRPLYARVILGREKFEKSKGGIFIPDSAKKRHANAVGVLLGKGPDADPSIEVGKTYIFGRYAGDWVNAEGKVTPDDTDAEFYVCNDEDLIAEVVR